MEVTIVEIFLAVENVARRHRECTLAFSMAINLEGNRNKSRQPADRK